MSSMRRPVGPLPPRVYWRRRLMVLLVLAALVAVVVLIVVRPGAGAADPAGQTSPSESAGSEAAASASPAAQQDGGTCLPSSVRVEPITDAGEYQAGTNPQLSLRITNVGAVPCEVNAGTTQQLFQITSGADVVWRSTDCQVDPVDAVVTLEPNVPQSTAPFAWDRTRSDASACDAEGAPMAGGGASYHLEVSVGEYEGADTRQFLLY
jgi:hypothetical protein